MVVVVFFGGEVVGFVVFALFFLVASFCNTFQVFIGGSQ